MDGKLKPCPFCGGKAIRHDIEAREDADNAGASYIECTGCGACTQLHFDRKENLVDSWNRRNAELSRLREALKDVRGSIKNARGAVESNQVADKDVHGTLCRAISKIDAALNESREGE